MNYNIKSHPTKYNDVLFRSRLEARWAAFFDLAKWEWEYEPIDLNGWSPDFMVVFPCNHSECNGSHSLLVEVKPYFIISDFLGHPCMDYLWGIKPCHIMYNICVNRDSCEYKTDNCKIYEIPANSSAGFGSNTFTTYWEMSHGAGGGSYSVDNWVYNSIFLWKEAGELVKYVKS
jgi:hypothetical protein